MGRVVVQVRVINAADEKHARDNPKTATAIRETTVEALVDSGATFFCLPESMIRSLGLDFLRWRETRTVLGSKQVPIYGVARLEVEGRDCIVEVMGLPEERVPLLGQLPLEAMDFWIDLTNQRLVGNPEHGGQWMAEV